MIALIDSDLEAEIGHTWLDSAGYPKFSIGHQQDYHVHRYVAEKALGRKLATHEHVHHLNYNKLDARRENLVICPSYSYHKLLHARTDSLLDGFSPDTHHYCTSCGIYHVKELFPKNKNAWNGVHNMCKESSNKARRGKGYGEFTWMKRLQQQYRRVFSQYTKREICSILKEGSCL